VRFLAYNSPKTVWRPGFVRTRCGSLSAPPDHLVARGGERREGKGIGGEGRGRDGREKEGTGKEERGGKGGERRGKGKRRGGEWKRERDAPLTQIPGSAPGAPVPSWTLGIPVPATHLLICPTTASSPMMPVLADFAQATRRSALSVARTTSATGALQRPNHVCGTRYHST